MKRIISLSFIAALSAHVCFAQATSPFNTIAHKPSLYRIQRQELEISVLDDAESMIKTEVRENYQAISETNAARKRLLYDYLSVSMPLKDIHVTSPFGYRNDPFTGKKSKHNGLDLRANSDEAFAMMPGQVIKVGQDKRSGIYVTMRCGDYTVSYCHLSQPMVKRNEWVSPGDVVGITGNTGRCTAPHLHITAKFKGKVIDPTFLLNFVRSTQSYAFEQLSQQMQD